MHKILLYGNGFDIELGRRLGLGEETDLRQIIKNEIFAIPGNISRHVGARIERLPGGDVFLENYFRVGEQFEREVELFINNFELEGEIPKEDVTKKRNIIKKSIATFKEKRKKAYEEKSRSIMEPVYRNLDLLLNKKVYKNHDEKLLVDLSVEQRKKYAKNKLSDENMRSQVNLIQNIANILRLYQNYDTLLTTNYLEMDEIIIPILKTFTTIKRFIDDIHMSDNRIFSVFEKSHQYRKHQIILEFGEITSFLGQFEEFSVFSKMRNLFVEWAIYNGPGKIGKSYKVNSFNSLMGNIDYMDYVYPSNTKDIIFSEGNSTPMNTLEKDWLNNISNISKDLSQASESIDIMIFGFNPVNDIFLMKIFDELMDNDSNVTFLKYSGDCKRVWYVHQMELVEKIFRTSLESYVGSIEELVESFELKEIFNEDSY